jgi:hypothetical protein
LRPGDGHGQLSEEKILTHVYSFARRRSPIISSAIQEGCGGSYGGCDRTEVKIKSDWFLIAES